MGAYGVPVALLALAVFAAGSYADVRSSRSLGTSGSLVEANPLWVRPGGRFALARNVAWTALVAAAGLASLLAGEPGPAWGLGLGGLLRAGVALRNWRLRRAGSGVAPWREYPP